MIWRITAIAAGGLALAAMPALAHHSFAMFDQRKVMTLEGTVHEFQWTNPHAFIELDVPNGARGGSYVGLRLPNGSTLGQAG